MIDIRNNYDKSQIRHGPLTKPIAKSYVLDVYWSPEFQSDINMIHNQLLKTANSK